MQHIPRQPAMMQFPVLRRGRPRQRILVLGSPELGAGIAEGCPGARVDVFTNTWPAVERGRALMMRRGLEGRMSVHHRSAAATWREAPAGVTAAA